MADAIKEVRTIHFDNAVVTVRIPDLTEEERSRRMKEVSRAAEALIRASFDSEQEKGESA